MGSLVAAIIGTLLTSGMLSAVSHELTLLGGAAACVLFALNGLLSDRASIHPVFGLGAVALSLLCLISSESSAASVSSTIHILSCYVATVALACSSPDLSVFCRQLIFGNNLLLTVWVLFQAVQATELRAWAISNPSGTGNLMAAQINMTLPFVLMKIHDTVGTRRLGWQCLLGLNCLAVFLVMSRNGIGAMLIILTLYVLFNHKRMALMLIAMIGTTTVFLDQLAQIPWIRQLLIRYRIIGFKPVAPRSLIWEISSWHIQKNPWLGVGPGEPRRYLATLDIYHAHNNIIQVAFETGIPSAAIYTLMIGLLLLLPVRTMLGDRRTFMTTLPILAYFAYSWTGSPLSFPAATLLLAAVANEARLARKRQELPLQPAPQTPVVFPRSARPAGFGPGAPYAGRVT